MVGRIDLEEGSRSLTAQGFYLIPTYQNDVVLVSVGNPNLTQNGVVSIFILICFFFLQEGILVTYHCQNDVILIFPSNWTVMTNRVAKMQLFGSLGDYFITF